MKFRIDQKFLCFGDDFEIYDETGERRYYVDGKAFGFRKSFKIYNRDNAELVHVYQKLFTFSKAFYISRNGRQLAKISRKRFTVRPQFIIDVPGPDDYHITGDFVGHEYTIVKQSNEIARVSKHFFSFNDSYGVDIKGGEPVFILAAVVVIDLLIYNGKPKEA